MKYLYAILIAVLFSTPPAEASCNSKSLNKGRWNLYLTDTSHDRVINCRFGTNQDTCSVEGSILAVGGGLTPAINPDCSFTLTGITLSDNNGIQTVINLEGQINSNKSAVVGQFTYGSNAIADGSFTGLNY